MKKIIINSDNRRFNISSIVVGYLEENKEEVLEFEIPEKYAEYGKKACFSANGQTFAKTFDDVISNKLTITRDISQFKELDMTIAFFKIEDEDEIIARTSILHILIENAIVCDDDVKPDEPKIIVLDNLIQKVQELNNEISLNENERLENENTRQTNEEERINNENSREEYITNLKDKVDDGEFNGKSLEFVWQGTKLGIRLQGQQEYQFVDLVGAVGPIGPQGNPFQVKKTYSTIDEMINDYDNMQINDYVMISGNVEEEDNAKLFVKTENETPIYRWQYLADFSGASGIQGPVGKTPNLKIGTVSTLNPNENATVEITGTYENPILNFGIPQGQTYQVNDEDLENIANEITSNANSSFNQNVLNKTIEFNNNATTKTNEFNTNADTKLQEYNTNADNKIAEYDLHSQELDNKIIDTRNELERIKNDVLETGTDTDTFVHLEDSAMAEYQELSVDGVCKQDSTSGKNKFNNMLFEEFTSNLKYIDVILEANKKYTVSSNLPKSSQGTANIFAYNSSSSGASTGKNDIGVAAASRTITTNDDGKIIIAYRDNNSELTDEKNKYLYQIEEGPDATEYEPYTGGQPSPNPDYPQPISVIEDSLKITSCNKNILSFNNLEQTTKNGVTYSVENGVLKLNGTATNGILIDLGNVIAPSGTYYFSSVVTGGTGSYGRYITTKDGTNLKTNSGEITLNEYTELHFRFYINSGCIFSNAEVIGQLEVGDQATSFEQHLETQITANLPEGEFIGGLNDTVRDKLKVEYSEEDGEYHLKLYKNIGKKVLDGADNWNYYGESRWKFRIVIDDIKPFTNSSGTTIIPNIISNYYSTTFWNNTNNNGMITGMADILTTISFRNDECNTLDEFKSWLSTHNTEVYYQLATPYVVDLGVVDMPITYNEITNLFTDSDLLPQINAKYYRNFISTVRNLQVNEKALKQELIDINNRLSALESAQTSVASESEFVE